jgi:hypothetical protein
MERNFREVIMSRSTFLAIVLFVTFVLIASGLSGQSQKNATAPHGLDPAAVKAINEMGGDLEKLNESHRSLMEAVKGLDDLYAKLVRKAQEVGGLAAEAKKTRGPAVDQLIKATIEMQDMSQSFNLQYLQLQNRISQENRQFTMVSNIMKNKHDTAKNSINNIR